MPARSGIAAALGTGRSANAVQQHYEILAGIRFSRHQAQDWAVDRRTHQPANLAVAYAVPLPAPQPQPQPQPQPLQPEPEPPQPLSVAPAASSAGQRSRLRPHSAPPTGQAATAAPTWPRGGTGPLAVYATDPVSGDPRGAALHTLNAAATAAIYANIIFAQPWAQARAGAAAAGVGLPTALLASTSAASPSPLALPDQHAGRACKRCGTTTTPKWRSLARPRRTPPLHHPTRCPEYTLLASHPSARLRAAQVRHDAVQRVRAAREREPEEQAQPRAARAAQREHDGHAGAGLGLGLALGSGLGLGFSENPNLRRT